MRTYTDEEIALLTEQQVPPDPPFDPANAEPPPPNGEPTGDVEWNLDLGDAQSRAYKDPTTVVLLVGEKGSGKSFLGLCTLVQHCYDNDNALAVIISTTISLAGHGALYELENFVLPTFRDGNRHPLYHLDGTNNPLAGKLKDGGIGLKYTQARPDPISKDRYLYIQNRFGGWSMVLIKSILYPSQVQPRFTGITPSFIYVDEITETTGDEYFTFLSIQLGRRQGPTGPHQFVASCNPKGPSHWVYKTFHVDEALANDTEHPAPGFAVYHIPLDENLEWISLEYRRMLEQRLRDPIQRLRLIDGQWIDQPSGDAIFKDIFIEEIHVVGDVLGRGSIVPQPEHPCVLGWDPGPANFSVHFLQPLPCAEGLLWTVFDEVNLVGMRMSYDLVVKRVLRRMDYWENMAGIGGWNHVIDEAAFKHRNNRGSYDAKDIQDLAKGRILLRGCPKGNESVPTRVREIRDLLMADLILISKHCHGTVAMFQHLESETPKEGKYDPNEGFNPKRSMHIHPFDSVSYPVHFHRNHPAARYWATTQRIEIKPELYRAGGA